MLNLESLFQIGPFSLDKTEKTKFFNKYIEQLVQHHYSHCLPYKKLLDGLGYSPLNLVEDLSQVPFVPVRLFKELELTSVSNNEHTKSMTSSGTSGQQVSKIFLDKETSTNQVKVLTKITSQFVGKNRRPMLVIDSSSIIKNPNAFSARGAGILGFSILGKDVTYALDEKMNLNYPVIESFLEKYSGQSVLLFGFTSIIWEHFYEKLKSDGKSLDFGSSILIHGGGWKKMIEKSVSSDDFKNSLKGIAGIQKIFNYYGMVEQTGSIFMEGECGHLHCSIYSDILIRRADLSLCEAGEPGIIQLFSLLPQSYPGHVILTEDVGTLLGEDDCHCGLKGKYFQVQGRLKNAEIRGCSDTYRS